MPLWEEYLIVHLSIGTFIASLHYTIFLIRAMRNSKDDKKPGRIFELYDPVIFVFIAILWPLFLIGKYYAAD